MRNFSFQTKKKKINEEIFLKRKMFSFHIRINFILLLIFQKLISSNIKDYYQILGIHSDATNQQIKRQFHKLGKIKFISKFCFCFVKKKTFR